MDKVGILSRVLKRISLDSAIDVIKEYNPNYKPEKKPKKKEDVKQSFLALQSIIRDEEIEDFVQMAVMKKSKGLPVYTYKVTNLAFLKGIQFSDGDFPIFEQYTIKINIDEDTNDELKLSFRVKEYTTAWKTGVKNVESLSAVYSAKVNLNKKTHVLSIFTGNNEIHDVIVNYLSLEAKWPIEPFKMRKFPNQISNENASYKTILMLDFVYNRLVLQGIKANFREIKFSTGSNQRKKEGIKDVTINGQNLLSSQLACEYITLGSDIVYFKLDMEYKSEAFTTIFYLFDYNYDKMKIVVVDNESVIFKNDVMKLIQTEYIAMCDNGLVDEKNTKRNLHNIYEKYSNKDVLLNKSIATNVFEAISSMSNMLELLDDGNEIVQNSLRKFAQSNRAILDSIAYDGSSEKLDEINTFINGCSENDDIDG